MTIDRPSDRQLPELRALWQEAFGDGDEFFDKFLHTAYSPDRARFVTVDGRVAAALYIFDCECRGERVAYIYGVATKKEYRRRGLCKALMESTHDELLAKGYAGALLVPASEPLFGFYSALGYSVCANIREISVAASNEKAELRRIDGARYASRRRELLPSGGVIQENENIRFLEATAELYESNGCIIAARKEGDILYAAELLGNAEEAPAVLSALGCKEGRLRVPEDFAADKSAVRPFAMYHALTAAAPPTYFALAFD